MTIRGTARPAGSGRGKPVEVADMLRHTAVLTLLGAAVIHAKVTPEHFEEWVAAGVFFVVITVVQAGLALGLLLSRRPLVYFSALTVSALAVLVWVVSRTAGLPFGPDAGTPEVVGRPDTVATTFEVATVAVTLPLLMLAPPVATGRSSRWRWAVVAMVATVVIAMTGFAIASPEEPRGEHARSPTAPLVPAETL
jgi:hypothetical protein